MHQTIIWTTLPRGLRFDRERGQWRAGLTLFVSPRVDVDNNEAALRDFPDFLNWPTVLESTRYWLYTRLGDTLAGPPIAIEPQIDEALAPEPETWRALLHANAPVRGYDVGDGRTVTAHSYDRATIARQLRECYVTRLLAGDAEQWLTQAAAKRPYLTALTLPVSAPIDHQDLIARWQELDDSEASAWEQFCLFHRRLSHAQANDDDRPPLDFHEAVSAFGSYPALLRKLGLAIDFEIELAALLAHDCAVDALKIVAMPRLDPAGSTTHCRPWTAVEMGVPEHDAPVVCDTAIFVPRSEPSQLPNQTCGFLRIDAPALAIVQEDVDNAALGLIAHMHSQARRRDAGDGRIDDEGALPALTTSAMTLVHANFETAIESGIAKRAAMEKWLAALPMTPNDKAATDEPANDEDLSASGQVLYAQDLTRGYRVDVRRAPDGVWRSLCRRATSFSTGLSWRWPQHGRWEDEGTVSLSVSESASDSSIILRSSGTVFAWDGWSLVAERPGRAVAHDGASERVEPRVDAGFPLEVDAQASPGSLERQRFGQAYSFRVRTVDLAGNSWSVREADELIAATDTETTVVSAPIPCSRHEPGQPPLLLAAAPRLDGEAGDMLVIREYPGETTMPALAYLLPPRIPLDLAERHGMFDGMDAKTAWRLLREHEGSLPEDYDEDFLLAQQRGDETNRYLAVPYIPDPLCQRAILTAGDDGEPLTASLRFNADGAQELAGSCTLVLTANAGDLSQSARMVTVHVPRGRRRTIHVSAAVDPETVSTFALANWLHGSDPALRSPSTLLSSRDARDASSALQDAANRGHAPAIAPPRPITLVHAVPKPITAPQFGAPTVERRPGENEAVLHDNEFTVDARSTVRVEFTARWSETVDEPGTLEWVRSEDELHAFGIDVAPEGERPLRALHASHAERRALAAQAGLPSPGAHAFPDHKYRLVTYQAVATSRFVDFYPEAFTRDARNITVAAQSAPVIIAATAPPAPPQVDFIVPAFRRTQSSAWPSPAVERWGGGVRIYLKRPWFSSGDGERLAVVFATERRGVAEVAVTEWGLNPIKRGGTVPPRPALDDLRSVDGEQIERFDVTSWDVRDPKVLAQVSLVTLPVQLDPVRDRVYCDVELAPGDAFFPMLRLALARYQPHAVPGANLSTIVKADFIALAPDRALTVERLDSTTVTLQLAGPSYLDPLPDGGLDDSVRTSRVRVRVERPVSEIEDDALRFGSWDVGDDESWLNVQRADDGNFVWRGRATLPDSKHRPCRIVLEEFAEFDAADPSATSGRVHRLVYAESVIV